ESLRLSVPLQGHNMLCPRRRTPGFSPPAAILIAGLNYQYSARMNFESPHVMDARRWLLAALIGCVMAGIVLWQTVGQHLPGGDSATVATMVAKDMRPNLYPRDAFYNSDRWYRLYIPS